MTSSSWKCWAVLAGLLLSPAPGFAESRLVLSFGVYTSDKPTVMYRKFKPTLSALEEHLSKDLERPAKIKLKIYNTYDAAIQAFALGEVDFVRFGPASFITARRMNPGVQLLAMEEVRGSKTFSGVIFCRTESRIRRVSDLKGRSFAFGDENSTIGRYLAQALLVENGIHAHHLSRHQYLGRHDRVATAVLHGRFDAGAAKESTFRKYKDRGLREIVRFTNVTKPWVARSGLPREVVRALSRGLVRIRDPKVLKSISSKMTGFVEVSSADYEPVRIGMEKAEQFFKGAETASERAPLATQGSTN